MDNDFQNIPLNKIRVVDNYRKTFNELVLKGLAASIKKNGVLQPILVRPDAENIGGYCLVAGERRVRACEMAGMASIPALIKEIEKDDVLRQQIVENVQRENVHFMETAHGIKRLRDEGSYDMDEISRIIGKHATLCYALLSLTRMSDEAQRLASSGWLSQQVCFHIAKLPDAELQTKAANDLSRTRKDKWVTESGAKHYIRDNFGDSANRIRKRRVEIAGPNSDYVNNWKKYLVSFSSEQFEGFKKIVRGRTETGVLAEAVDLVMRRDDDDRAAALEKDIVDSAPKARSRKAAAGVHADPDKMGFQNA